ncbi:hypothetical protein [Rhizobium lentis]|uniref:Uncharacterized protein n=1 Tax=Rhizobium lentis TaxID=1138194 RepID=A0A9Q3M6K6_9HYPH|nr:hypothetical protein [Rhizobium lentis]MBX5021177.1 hypothetical protein [Rhizobium lentis]
MSDHTRAQFEAAVVERLKESGLLEIEIRTECLVRCGDGYQDEVINAGWHYFNAGLAIAAPPAIGFVTVPVEPPEALLKSMAIRYDHGLGVPGYYDQQVFGAENVGHARRLESTMTTMRQLYEEVVGKGFYRANR